MQIPRRSLLLAGASLPLLRLPATAAEGGKTLVFGLSSYPPSLEPWKHTGTAAGCVKQLLHRGLTSFGPDGTPSVVERFEIPDPKSTTGSTSTTAG